MSELTVTLVLTYDQVRILALATNQLWTRLDEEHDVVVEQIAGELRLSIRQLLHDVEELVVTLPADY